METKPNAGPDAPPTAEVRPSFWSGGIAKGLLALVVVLAALGGGWRWWQRQQAELPPGIAFSNGRLEAEEVDVATTYGGRIAEILVREGDLVVAGQILARMDTAEAAAHLRQAEAETRRQQQSVAEADALVVQHQSELDLVRRNLQRTLTLAAQGHVAQQRVDQERAQAATALAVLHAAETRVQAASEAVAASTAAADTLREKLGEATLRAPRAGRVQYRLAQPGEVLASGGKLLTLLDLSEVFMTLFLPTAVGGRLQIGAEARIKLDARPDTVLPGRVTYVDAKAQFTPRHVETQSERDKMMYRTRVHLPPLLLRRYAEEVRVGLTGIGYVRIDPAVAWPDELQSSIARESWDPP
ncbi:MAG: HlyD family efflux transporter periplasmic adaptor subunit [Alphaproteobacteria bacterium]|nr:MAG: HlyD family efflux transporter periplasmic adaptor subunit [Alphaproteobacteria bacterium]